MRCLSWFSPHFSLYYKFQKVYLHCISVPKTWLFVHLVRFNPQTFDLSHWVSSEKKQKNGGMSSLAIFAIIIILSAEYIPKKKSLTLISWGHELLISTQAPPSNSLTGIHESHQMWKIEVSTFYPVKKMEVCSWFQKAFFLWRSGTFINRCMATYIITNHLESTFIMGTSTCYLFQTLEITNIPSPALKLWPICSKREKLKFSHMSVAGRTKLETAAFRVFHFES